MYKSIIKLLDSRGYEAFIEGETARDIYMNRTPVRNCVAVAATFEELQQNFGDYITHKDPHLTVVTINYKNNIYIVRPLRRITLDHTYCSYRFTKSFETDAKSKGYSIESLYYNPLNDSWLNFNQAKQDIDNKIVRLINDPYDSILESKIRLLSGPVLVGILGEGWKLDSTTHEAIQKYYLKIVMAHSAQVNIEMVKLLTEVEKPSRVFNILRSTKVLEEIFPELLLGIGLSQSNKGKEGLDLYNHIMYALDSVHITQDNCLLIRLGALLHDIAKPHTEVETDTGMHFYSHELVGAAMAERIMFRWGFAKPMSRKVSILVKNHLFDAWARIPTKTIRKLINRVGPENIHDLIDLRIADRHGTGRKDISMDKVHKYRTRVNKELTQIAPKQVKLNINDADIKKYIRFATDNTLEAVPHIKTYLESKIIYGRVENKVANLKRAIREINKIQCPLDKAHLFKTWSDILKGNEDTFEDGRLKCGVYCGFICDKKKPKK